MAERRKAQAEAYELARHDVLTWSPQPALFIEDFEKWAYPLRKARPARLFMIDLDNFNDVDGHRLCDEVLKVVARRLRRTAEGGSVARR